MPFDITITPNNIDISLKDIHLSKENTQKISQLLDEFTYAKVLATYQLPLANKVLFHGKSGCGKTATAKSLAKALHRKIIILNLSEFVSSKLGETGKNIHTIFKKAIRENAILFLDEFDSIGKARDYANKDSGEMKRLVNIVIQLMDNMPSNATLIAATNHRESIDTALLRRFEFTLQFSSPSIQELDHYYDTLLEKFPIELREIHRKYDISYAEAKDLLHNQLKQRIILQEKAKEQKKHDTVHH